MPVFAKFDGVDGEATDSFVFRKGGADPAPTQFDDFTTKPNPDDAKGLLLPAVQKFMDDGAPTQDGIPMEDFSMGFTEVEWTY